MASLPRVTIGMSVFNAAETLPLTLRSIFCQSFTDWELIVADDGSTDGSLEILRGLRDPRVRIITSGDNLGASSRLNEISREARAPLVARMDADDLMHPRRLEKEYAYLSEHPDVDVVGSSAYSIDNRYQLRGRRSRSRLPSSEFAVGVHGLLMHPTVMGKTRWFLANPYNESASTRRAQDAELWFRAYRRSVFALIDEPLLYYMEDQASVMRRLRQANLARIRVMFRGNSELRQKRLSMRLAVALTLALKMGFYEVCRVVGAREYLVNRRSRPLRTEEREEAEAVLRQIEEYPVPGLP